MKWSKYTIDQFDKEIAVLLKYPEETEKLLLPRSQFNDTFQEGDIVHICKQNETYEIRQLKEETQHQKEKIQNLIEELKKNGGARHL
ncbi:DUF3006 domain-containing protein [Psychrobacillus vulpis]|uniref:DUF3006 domain-containing protein n=1 Tax=Psychrobacillus vulpis TaxID=2325572 RepID=UPI00140B72CA|nr:DUF3006 domain-containing protein [Psychrobacillus vulpis]